MSTNVSFFRESFFSSPFLLNFHLAVQKFQTKRTSSFLQNIPCPHKPFNLDPILRRLCSLIELTRQFYQKSLFNLNCVVVLLIFCVTDLFEKRLKKIIRSGSETQNHDRVVSNTLSVTISINSPPFCCC